MFSSFLLVPTFRCVLPSLSNDATIFIANDVATLGSYPLELSSVFVLNVETLRRVGCHVLEAVSFGIHYKSILERRVESSEKHKSSESYYVYGEWKMKRHLVFSTLTIVSVVFRIPFFNAIPSGMMSLFQKACSQIHELQEKTVNKNDEFASLGNGSFRKISCHGS